MLRTHQNATTVETGARPIEEVELELFRLQRANILCTAGISYLGLAVIEATCVSNEPLRYATAVAGTAAIAKAARHYIRIEKLEVAKDCAKIQTGRIR